VGSVAISFLAGSLSILSPCVLPLLPIVIASALQQHRHGPLALGAGLVLSSAGIGLLFASLGFALSVDRDLARTLAGAIMAAVGAVLLVPRLQEAFARATAPLGGAAGTLASRIPPGLGGQFVLGLLLGAVWTPCTGPTLAAAATMAARSESLVRAGAIMLAFGVGAVAPLVALAYGSRRALGSGRGRLASLAAIGKPLMGVLLLVVGALALTGGDKAVETWLVERMPDWLVDLTTLL